MNKKTALFLLLSALLHTSIVFLLLPDARFSNPRTRPAPFQIDVSVAPITQQTDKPKKKTPKAKKPLPVPTAANTKKKMEERQDTFAPPQPPQVPGGVLSPAKALTNIDPTYPEISRDLEEEGIVSIEVRINKKGRVEKTQIVSSSGSLWLDDAATEELKKTIFEPARLGLRPVPSSRIFKIRFRINDD